jgi:hypothetical protein
MHIITAKYGIQSTDMTDKRKGSAVFWITGYVIRLDTDHETKKVFPMSTWRRKWSSNITLPVPAAYAYDIMQDSYSYITINYWQCKPIPMFQHTASSSLPQRSKSSVDGKHKACCLFQKTSVKPYKILSITETCCSIC